MLLVFVSGVQPLDAGVLPSGSSLSLRQPHASYASHPGSETTSISMTQSATQAPVSSGRNSQPGSSINSQKRKYEPLNISLVELCFFLSQALVTNVEIICLICALGLYVDKEFAFVCNTCMMPPIFL